MASESKKMTSRELARLAAYYLYTGHPQHPLYGYKVQRKEALITVTAPDGEQWEIRVTKVRKAKEGD